MKHSTVSNVESIWPKLDSLLIVYRTSNVLSNFKNRDRKVLQQISINFLTMISHFEAVNPILLISIYVVEWRHSVFIPVLVDEWSIVTKTTEISEQTNK